MQYFAETLLALGRQPYLYCQAKRHFGNFGGWVALEKTFVTF